MRWKLQKKTIAKNMQVAEQVEERWPVSNNIHSREEEEKEKIPRTEKRKGSRWGRQKTDKTCGEDPDNMDKRKKQLRGQHMFHTTKYGSEDLLRMRTKVSTVKGTTRGKVQTVEALADSGASASLILWNLAKS